MSETSGAAGLIGLVSVLGALVLVCGLAFVVLKLLQRMPGGMGGAGQGAPVRFLRSLPVGQRERVTLVSYRGEVFMLGVSPGGVTLLARMEEEATPEPEEGRPADPWLAERFRAAVDAAKARRAPPQNSAEG